MLTRARCPLGAPREHRDARLDRVPREPRLERRRGPAGHRRAPRRDLPLAHRAQRRVLKRAVRVLAKELEYLRGLTFI